MGEPSRTAVEFARAIRIDALRMVHHANASHIGSCLSIADVLAVLYTGVLRVDPAAPDWPERDRFLLSKGHAAAIFYAALAERGFFPLDELTRYCDASSLLTGHASHHVPGVEISTGSLGHALPIGCGMALAAQREQHPYRVVVLLSDGELDEGSNWEAILFAAHHQLDRLTVIVDVNGWQGFGATAQVMNLAPLAEKFRAFGWAAREIDGHDHARITETCANLPFAAGQPSVLLARTVKGKGVSYMEDQLAWHYRSPKDEHLRDALRELGVDA